MAQPMDSKHPHPNPNPYPTSGTLNDNDNDDDNDDDDDDLRKVLDQQFYYYQTKAGGVSRTHLSTRQLIRLLCPVREGLAPILPPNTQCLPVHVQVLPESQSELQSQSQSEATSSSSSYGSWTAASSIPVLREAACRSWFWTNADGSPPGGPGSCRKLLEVAGTIDNGIGDGNGDGNGDESGRAMVFAKDVTPEWTAISAMKDLRLVLATLATDGKRGANPPALPMEPSEESGGGQGQNASPGEGDDVQHELEAFLSSATAGDHDGKPRNGHGDNANKNDNGNGNDIDDHLYESDGGTRYVKDPLSGNWIHEALAPKPSETRGAGKPLSGGHNNNNNNKKSSSSSHAAATKKSKKARFAKRNAKLWIYVSGLPKTGVTEDDLQKYFSRAGLLDLDPETLKPKIKLYRDRATGDLKGDASLRYARPESVELALQILDKSPWDKDHCITVEKATFAEKQQASAKNENANAGDPAAQALVQAQSTTRDGDGHPAAKRKRKRPISEAQRKVARLALLQARDEGFGGRLAGGRKGLCIIVVKNLMEGIPDDRLEPVLDETFREFGSIEKITCISKTRVVIVKYGEPIAASTAIDALHGSRNPRTNEKLEAIYWDGITDYTTLEGDDEREKEEEERRQEEFGNWLDSQEELPPELQLQVAED